MSNINEVRKPEHQIDTLFYERWSPRAMTGEEISNETLNQLFEAARWAPSCFNEQPWNFLYAKKDSEDWGLFLKILVEVNQLWAKNASVLIACISKKTFTRNGKPNGTHSFDAGAAWQNLALQAYSLGWSAHGMAGVDYKKGKVDLKIPEDYQLEMMIAVGKQAEVSILPEDFKKKEWPPSGRKSINDFVQKGQWK